MKTFCEILNVRRLASASCERPKFSFSGQGAIPQSFQARASLTRNSFSCTNRAVPAGNNPASQRRIIKRTDNQRRVEVTGALRYCLDSKLACEPLEIEALKIDVRSRTLMRWCVVKIHGDRQFRKRGERPVWNPDNIQEADRDFSHCRPTVNHAGVTAIGFRLVKVEPRDSKSSERFPFWRSFKQQQSFGVTVCNRLKPFQLSSNES